MVTAITRGVSSALSRCELSFLARQEIDIGLAMRQHREYEECLRSLGAAVVSLPAEPDLPDCMFVEDPAVVVTEVAIMTRMGAESRRREAETLAPVLARYRPLRWMTSPATLEGGDVLRIGSTFYVGVSRRSNAAGIEQLSAELSPFGYKIQAVQMRDCLHLKSACCSLDSETILVNRDWIDPAAFEGLCVIDVPADEPQAANVLVLSGTVVVAESFPHTAALLDRAGYTVRRLDISELQKAEAGLTCSSILLD
jgi:dimethylargininase